MTFWNLGDDIKIDLWKPDLAAGSKKTYRQQICAFCKISNINAIRNFDDLERSARSYIDNAKKVSKNFDLGRHIETLYAAFNYFGWLLGLDGVREELVKILGLCSKNNTSKKRSWSRKYMQKYKLQDPNYVKRQKIIQREPRIKKKKLDWAREHQKWDSELSEIVDEIKKNSDGCKFKNCNCQKEKIPGLQNFQKIITGHHKKPKEINPELTRDKKNILDICLGHHVWVHVICALYQVFPDRIHITKSAVVRQLVVLTRIFSDAESHIIKKILDDLVNSLRLAVGNPTLENLEKSHIHVYALNQEIINRLERRMREVGFEPTNS